jgi:predicted TPR repeat methyltransferase
LKIDARLSYERELSLIIKKFIESNAGRVNGRVTVLDVGCGRTSLLYTLNEDKQLREKILLTGLDIDSNTIEWANSHGFHDNYVLCDIEHYHPFEKYDFVIATDLIEHLDKAQSLEMIAKLEAITRIGLLIITPNGYIENPVTDENPFMAHKCGYSVKDLKDLGYRVTGAGGPGILRTTHAVPRWNVSIMYALLSLLSRTMRPLPSASFHLIAKKLLEQKQETPWHL